MESISIKNFLCIMKMVSQTKFKIIGGNPIREILETLFKYKQVDMIAGAICIDHVHLSVAIPQKSSEFVERNAENQAFLTCKFHICLLY